MGEMLYDSHANHFEYFQILEFPPIGNPTRFGDRTAVSCIRHPVIRFAALLCI